MQEEDKILLEHITKLLTNHSIGGIITLLFAIFIQGWLVWYFSYFKKSGENKAIKEDIDKITKIVEGVKSDIEVVTSNKVSLHSERRKAILEYYEYLNIWKDSSMNPPIGGLNDVVYSQVCADYRLQRNKYYLAEAKAEMFIEEYDFIEIKTKINLKLNALELKALKIMGSFNLFHNQTEIFKAAKYEKGSGVERIKELGAELTKEHDEFSKTSVEIFKELYPSMVIMKEFLRSLLYETLEQS